MKAVKARWSIDGDGTWLSLLIDPPDAKRARELAASADGPQRLEIKPWRERRSLDANAYFWVLCGKLAEKTGIGATEIYRSLIPEIGGNSETVCITQQGADRLCEGWEHNGKGWITERIPSKLPGCVNVILYYGSSAYDTAQMSRLIGLVVQECRQQGIETLTPAELAALMEGWDAKTNKGAGDPDRGQAPSA